MPNPFSSLGAVPIMATIQDMLQKQANLRNSTILGNERQQQIDMRQQEMTERSATMKVLAQDLAALGQFLSIHPQEAQTMSYMARQAAGEHDWDVAAPRFVKHYQEVLSGEAATK